MPWSTSTSVDAPKLTDISRIEHFQQLKSIDVSDTAAADPLATWSLLRDLREVRMNGCNMRNSLRELRAAAKFEVVEVARTAVVSLDGLTRCANMAQVDVSLCASLVDLAVLSGLQNLKYANAPRTAISGIRPIDSFITLGEVHFGGCREGRDLSL